LRDFYPEQRVVALYLNFKTIPSRLHVRGGGRRVEAPYWLIDRCTVSLEDANIFFLVRGNENQIFRIGLTSEKTIIEPFLFAGYPALSLEGEYEPLEPAQQLQWLISFRRYFRSFIQSFESGIPETWDRHYLYFQVRGFYFSISEKTYLIILLTVLSGILLYGLIYSGRLKKYLRTILRNFWSIPILFLICFLLLFAATWTLEGIQYARNIVDLWESFPLLFLIFKLILPLVLLLLFSRLVRFRFPRNGSFYSASALLFLLLDILILALINISFTYYFLWAFTFALLFSAASNKLLKTLFFLAAPYWLVKTIVELFTLPRLEFCRVLLFSKVWGNLLLALIFLPFILMFIRLRMILPVLRRLSRPTRALAWLVPASTILMGLLIIFLFYSPYREKQQIITAHYLVDRVNGENSLQLTSTGPLGGLTVWDGENRIQIDSHSRKYNLPLPEVPELLHITINSVGFLDRKNIQLDLKPVGTPYKLTLTLNSEEEFVLFDSNFPYVRQPGGREYTLLIGANPPLPLSVQLTVPRDRTFNLHLVTEYLSVPADFQLYAADKQVEARFTLIKTLEIKT